MRYRFIRPLVPPPERWAGYLEPAYTQRHFSNFGPVNQRFEHAMAKRFGGGRIAVSTANATVGLMVALAALGVQGNVLVPSFTFAATALAVQAAGCIPILCDCDPESLMLSAASVAEAAQAVGQVGALLPVLPFGLVQDMTELEFLARTLGCPIVVDAAAALGAPVARQQHTNRIEVFSLHATKCFPIGEGGLILAPPRHETAIRRAENFGFANQQTVGPGTNGKLSEFHAAIGLAVLDDFDATIARRQYVANRYAETLGRSAKVDRVWRSPSSPWNTYPVLLRRGIDAAAVIDEATKRGLELRSYYRPLHTTPHFRDVPRANSLAHTEDLAARIVCLPVYSDMTESEQEDILRLLDGLIV